ncbi:MAG: hypothetical protein P4L91_18530 [Burkholderiaceae bacterium]|nr:hypothetical protein [Burkholderiaceae bacterium]
MAGAQRAIRWMLSANIAPGCGLGGVGIIYFAISIFQGVKMFKRVFFAVATIAVLTSSTVRAADERFCRDYARVAVDQAHRAERHGRCDRARRENPARWQGDFRGHYDWCRGVHRDNAEAERAERDRTLDYCAR